ARAARFFGEQIFDHPRVTPAEEAVEIAKLLIKIVVSLRADLHDLDRNVRRLPNHLRQRPNLCIGSDPLAVLDSVLQKTPRDYPIGTSAGDYECAEAGALAALD